MRVLVTGASGFLGSHLAADLVARGHEVVALLRPGSQAPRLAGLMDRLRVVHATLEDRAALNRHLTTVRPDAIAHLGWDGVGNVDRNAPRQARNVGTTVDLLALAADAGARIFVGAGSQAEYGPCDHVIRETDPTRPTTLYGHAKLAAGAMADRLAALRDVRFAWLRVFSTYGAGDNPGWLISDLIGKLKRRERMALTRGEQRWGFLHARDAAAAFRTVLESDTAHGVFNVGSPDAPPLRDTILTLRDLIDPTVELGFGEVPYRPDQVMLLQADIARLVALGWRPEVDLRRGLAEAVAAHA
ncbi:NAD(P)-dependent oxidoreductase [Rhodoplanes sp. TEM]|uniref:NAD(P)-dependent oxidoreductase n=1 Tax=Rhodoplanes tepidamans TaxID=200616 RepID=A0ABT5J461_RHOTP|nr:MULTISPECIES: NAD(P)-dependent oxidoreductase [Rhodoplanes]MDC7784338.1 NAD(P)-dependent oxidoreductase [Rhodoplanes tepidamans]MDC7983398.1 NAD(P)-dependent oxidoreductase [Rhodoplanes sp. TEM]MDQ0354534.1 nucleoside-diphosphate-sugar epimerase [Rhodoplanes tepidamans]